jgi:hypothetical protein
MYLVNLVDYKTYKKMKVMSKKKNLTKDDNESLKKDIENTHKKNEALKDNNDGSVNSGNLVNSGRTKNRTELHTKSVVLGSDSDGQAD